MFLPQAPIWHHDNQENAEAACEHCQAIVSHEPWCITRCEAVLYAYEAAADANKLQQGDRLILHALGVQWASNDAAEEREPRVPRVQ